MGTELKTKTVGVSPKVAIPAIILAAAGAGLLIAGFIIGDETLKQIGGSLLAASGVTGVAGGAASPGTVVKE